MKRKKIKFNHSLVCVLGILLLLLYWIWLLYVTQSATPNNTYQTQECICAVEIRLASHRGSDKLFILTQNSRYMLDTGWRNKTQTTELAEQLRTENQPVTMTVWKHFPKWLFDLDGSSFDVQQVVDIRNNSDVLWDVGTHNNYQYSERITGVVVGVIFSPIIMLFIFINWLTKPQKRKTRDDSAS